MVEEAPATAPVDDDALTPEQLEELEAKKNEKAELAENEVDEATGEDQGAESEELTEEELKQKKQQEEIADIDANLESYHNADAQAEAVKLQEKQLAKNKRKAVSSKRRSGCSRGSNKQISFE